MKNAIFCGALAVSLAAAPVLADMPPPENALLLSEIIAVVEQSDDVLWIDELGWDDDGYWEVEYYTADNRKVDVKINPLTGEPLPR